MSVLVSLGLTPQNQARSGPALLRLVLRVQIRTRVWTETVNSDRASILWMTGAEQTPKHGNKSPQSSSAPLHPLILTHRARAVHYVTPPH